MALVHRILIAMTVLDPFNSISARITNTKLMKSEHGLLIAEVKARGIIGTLII
jgi:hypothetical protein